MEDDKRISFKRINSKLVEVRKAIKIIKSNIEKKRESTLEIMKKYGISDAELRELEVMYPEEVKIPFSINERKLDEHISKLSQLAEEVTYGERQVEQEKEESTPQSKREEFIKGLRVPEESHEENEEDGYEEILRIFAQQKKAPISYYATNPSMQQEASAVNSSRERRNSEEHARRNVRSKPRNRKKSKFKRNLVIGAISIAALIGAIKLHGHFEYQKDIQAREGYVDNLIENTPTTGGFGAYLSLEFSQEELNKLVELESKIESFEGKEHEDLDGVEIISTAREFQEMYKDIVMERLEEANGYPLDEHDIVITRERQDLDGKPGDYTNKANISEIGFMYHAWGGSIPKELRDSIIAAYGEEGIERPTMSVEQLISLLDDQKIDKKEAVTILNSMLQDMKVLMTKVYEKGETNEIVEGKSTYDMLKEREEEIAEYTSNIENSNTTNTTNASIDRDDEER